MEVLFFHNTLADYRIPWFVELSKLCNVHFIITNERVNKKNYHVDNSKSIPDELECRFIAPGLLGYIEVLKTFKNLTKYDYVELPPVDCFHEYVISKMILSACKKEAIKTCYFWEKWEAPKEKQPIIRKIKNFILGFFAKNVFHSVDIIFSVGKKSREYFLNHGVPENKIAIIPDVSETSVRFDKDLRMEYKIAADKTIVLYFGRITEEKGLDVLIQSFYRLTNREQYYLIIAGDGPFRETCENLVHQLKIDNCTFAGRINPENRGIFFSNCDIFVFPATFRNGCVDVWGLTVNEAIQHGKVVIATDAVGSAYELIYNGKNGFRIQPENIELLTEAIEKANNPMIFESAREKNAELSEIYTYKNMAKTFLAQLCR